jgi:phospholipid/cholesterol/gamma-HCH transport system permease protein
MDDARPTSYRVQTTDGGIMLKLAGDWTIGRQVPPFEKISAELESHSGKIDSLNFESADLGDWDSLFMTRMLQCVTWCAEKNIPYDASTMPEGVRNLLAVATAVKPAKPTRDSRRFRPFERALARAGDQTLANFRFIGELTAAQVRLAAGRSNTRFQDFVHFANETGPRALGIVSLISILIGMILAYMAAIQLRKFGAEIYIADLVAIGMTREMGAVMTAIILAGRTGASYAAQLGTMQTNEEIDATVTLGISPMEFLVTPRTLGLLAVMPFLYLYSVFLGTVGGAVVSAGMGISFVQYFVEVNAVLAVDDVIVGLIKSVLFALIVAVAGCQAGLQAGRSAAAVGEATTKAVVRGIVYVIACDWLINFVFDSIGM